MGSNCSSELKDCITTYTGIHMNPLDPRPEDFRIEDIAHALPLICRGNGHVKTFFSVGQHCINCAREAEALKLPDRMVLVVCKINNYTYISHYVILNTPKFTEVFKDGKINTISAFRRRS